MLKYFDKKESDGFTLVEVLMVIAIIGFLASIVIVQTGTTRKKGEDAAIQSALREVRNAGELYYSDSITYEGVCDVGNTTLSDSGDFGRIKDYITQHNGPFGVIGCKDNAVSYAVISSMNIKDCWCVDSQGAAKEVSLNGAADCSVKLTTTSCP